MSFGGDKSYSNHRTPAVNNWLIFVLIGSLTEFWVTSWTVRKHCFLLETLLGDLVFLSLLRMVVYWGGSMFVCLFIFFCLFCFVWEGHHLGDLPALLPWDASLWGGAYGFLYLGLLFLVHCVQSIWWAKKEKSNENSSSQRWSKLPILLCIPRIMGKFVLCPRLNQFFTIKKN